MTKRKKSSSKSDSSGKTLVVYDSSEDSFYDRPSAFGKNPPKLLSLDSLWDSKSDPVETRIMPTASFGFLSTSKKSKRRKSKKTSKKKTKRKKALKSKRLRRK